MSAISAENGEFNQDNRNSACKRAHVHRMGGEAQAGMFLCNDCRDKFTVRTGTIFERSRRGMSGCRPFGFSGCSAPRSHVPLRSRPFAGGYDVRRHERLVALAISKLTTACFFGSFFA
jgi:hypothetical protein